MLWRTRSVMYWAFPYLLMTQLLWSQQGVSRRMAAGYIPKPWGIDALAAIVETVERFWTAAQHQSRKVDKSLGRMRPATFQKPF